MQYGFQGDTFRCINFILTYETLVDDEKVEQKLYAYDEEMRDAYLRLYPDSKIEVVDNSSIAFLEKKEFTQDEQKNGTLQNAIDFGVAWYKEYLNKLVVTAPEYMHENISTSQSAIGELSVIQAQYQNQNEMAIAELSMLFAGGVKNV